MSLKVLEEFFLVLGLRNYKGYISCQETLNTRTSLVECRLAILVESKFVRL